MKTATAGLRIAKHGRGDDRRQKPFEPFAGLGQFGRDARARGMHLGPDMMRDEPHDPLAIGGRQRGTGVGEPFGQPVDPEPPVGVEHDLDGHGVFQKSGDGGSERRAQHPRAPGSIASGL